MHKTFMKMDKALLIATVIFFIFGLIMILSASSMESYMRYGSSPYYYFIRQAIFLGVSLIIFLIVINIPTKSYYVLSKLALLGVAILLIAVAIIGHDANNAKSWLQIGPFSLQPSEFAKVAIILYLAMYYDKNRDKLASQWVITLPLLVCAAIATMVFFQPDLGTTIIIMLLTIIMFYAVPIKKEYRKLFSIMLFCCIALCVSIALITKLSFLQDYQKERFNFLNPCDRYQEKSGYQLCNSFIAFKNGGLTGQGIGESTQKYLYLPESYTDFIFPIIVEEWGLIVGIVIIFLYAFIIYRLLKIARRAKTLHGALIAYGVFAYLFLHIVINLVGVMGIAPLTGVPLPFLSYGGSYAISLVIALALAQRVEIETNHEQQKIGRSKKHA